MTEIRRFTVKILFLNRFQFYTPVNTQSSHNVIFGRRPTLKDCSAILINKKIERICALFIVRMKPHNRRKNMLGSCISNGMK